MQLRPGGSISRTTRQEVFWLPGPLHVRKAMAKHPSKERIMAEERRHALTLYVDRSSRQWVVLDAEGQFWSVPVIGADPWNQRRPFCPTDETALEPIPGHYKHM